MEGERVPSPFLRTPSNESSLAFSPDGRWVAYVSDQSGRQEVYIRPFPGPGEWIVASRNGGRLPRWAIDGGRLFYRQGDGFWSVSVQTDPVLEVGAPELLFTGPYGGGYALDPRGRGFVTTRRDTSPERSHFNVVQGWFGQLEALVEPTR